MGVVFWVYIKLDGNKKTFPYRLKDFN